MKPSDELFQLIKSLTKSEKRFFKLSSSLQSGDKNYMRLFNAIDKQEEYDESAIRKTFKKEKFIAHLPSEKNHLYRQILKSLRSYYSNTSVGTILKEQINDIEILFNKALYSQCHKALKRAKKLAYDHERFYFILELLEWEKKLIDMEAHFGKLDSNLDDILEEEKKVISQSENLGKYQLLFSRMNYFVRKTMVVRSKEELAMINEIQQDPFVKDEKKALSVSAKIVQNHIKGLCSSMHRNSTETMANFSRVAELMEENPIMIKEMPKRYVSSLNNLLFCSIDNTNYDKAFKIIARMRELAEHPEFSSIDMQLKIFTSSYNGELLIYGALGEFNKSVQLVGDIVDGLTQYDGKINKEEVTIFYYNIAICYFGVGDYNQALSWINKVLNDNENQLRQDLYSFSRLINLLIHFELGNSQLLEYIIRSTYRFHAKYQRTYKFETVVLKYIKKLSRVTNNDELISLFTQLKDELEVVVQDKYEKIALEYFDLISWLEAKIEGISFADAVKRRSMMVKY